MHRAGHRNRKELCVMQKLEFRRGQLQTVTFTYDFREKQ